MPMTSIGDMANGLMLRTRSTELKRTIARLTDELSSGRVSDVNARLGGDYAYLSDIETGMKRLDGYKVTSGEVGIVASTMQSAFERTHDIAGSLSATLLVAGTSSTGPAAGHFSTLAKADLSDIMSALNMSVAGRSLFSGTATDQPALASADVLLNGLRSAIAGQTDVTGIRAAADAWFSDPAGFSATVYTGANQDLTGFRISQSEVVTLSVRADNPVFRDLMKDVALAALADDPALGLDAQTQSGLRQASGAGLRNASDNLTGLRADLGFTEARIEASVARTSASRTSLEYARGKLLAADPYETATRLNEVQMQLQALYSVTVRSASLSLVNFLK